MNELQSIALNGLRAVAAVARAGTLAGAAEVLRVTPGAVSQQVARTEAALGLRLFDRRPDGMVPTERGAESAVSSTPALPSWTRRCGWRGASGTRC